MQKHWFTRVICIALYKNIWLYGNSSSGYNFSDESWKRYIETDLVKEVNNKTLQVISYYNKYKVNDSYMKSDPKAYADFLTTFMFNLTRLGFVDKS